MHKLLYAVLCGISAVSGSVVYAADIPDLQTEPRVMGYGEAYVGGLRVVPYFDNAETKNDMIAGGNVRINIPVVSGFNLQLDGLVDTIFDGERFSAPGINEYEYNVTNFGGAGHFYWRNPDRFAFGVMGSWTRYNFEDIGSYDPVGDVYSAETRHHDLKAGGLDAQLYLDRWTLYGQAYLGERTRRYFNFETGEDVFDYHFWGLRGIVRYYPTDNLRFDAEAGYGQEDLSPFEEFSDFTVNTWHFAVQATYRFEQNPFSVFGRYQFESRDQEGGDIFGAPLPDFHRFVVGLRYSFGSGSLLQEERNGPAMDTFQRASVLRR